MDVFSRRLSVIAIFIEGMIEFYAIYRGKIGASFVNRSAEYGERWKGKEDKLFSYHNLYTNYKNEDHDFFSNEFVLITICENRKLCSADARTKTKIRIQSVLNNPGVEFNWLFIYLRAIPNNIETKIHFRISLLVTCE